MVPIRVKNSKVIGKPVDQVYQYLADFSLHRERDEDAKQYLGTGSMVELGSTFQKLEVCDTVTVGTLGSATINTTKTIVRTVTQLEANKRLEYRVAGENGLMHRVEFFDLEPVALGNRAVGSIGDSIGEGEATRVTKGTDLMYPALRKNYLWLVLLVPVAWPFIIMNLLWMPSIELGVYLDHRSKLARIKKNLEGRARERLGRRNLNGIGQ